MDVELITLLADIRVKTVEVSQLAKKAIDLLTKNVKDAKLNEAATQTAVK